MKKFFNEVKATKEGIESFETGSVRDSEEYKGSPYLIPLQELNEIVFESQKYIGSNNLTEKDIYDEALFIMGAMTEICCYENKEELFAILKNNFIPKAFYFGAILCNKQYYENVDYSKSLDLFTGVYRSLAIHFANGAKKYSSNNWRKGQYLSRYFNSACRHLWSIAERDESEDHIAAFLWNLLAMYVTISDVEKGYLDKKFLNFPFIKKEIFNNG